MGRIGSPCPASSSGRRCTLRMLRRPRPEGFGGLAVDICAPGRILRIRQEVALSILAELVQVRRGRADFVASPGPATVAGVIPETITLEPVVDDIVLVDPVCGMTVERAHARHLADHDGIIYAFCSIGCRTRFIREPATYLSATDYSPMHD